MEIGARLHHAKLFAKDVEACAAFYCRLLDLQMRQEGPMRVCTANGRALIVAPGAPNRLGYAAYSFASVEAWSQYRDRVAARTQISEPGFSLFDTNAFMVTDPHGNNTVFGVAEDAAGSHVDSTERFPARLQHFAVRSVDPSKLLPFYRDTLGFIVSDGVYDESGVLRACFFRTDPEHHHLAIFHAAERAHDHLSFDTTDWERVRDWADYASQLKIPIVWGIGRHGPGNDVFFMVRDPEGNLVEISSEMEVCTPGRAEGRWVHEARTLNLWGDAIMRS